MIRFLFRLLSMLALAVAVILAVLDATRTVAAKQLTVTPLATSWEYGWPEGLAALRAGLESVAGFLWSPLAMSLLALPGFLIFGLLSLGLFAIGRRSKRGMDRFVIDR